MCVFTFAGEVTESGHDLVPGAIQDREGFPGTADELRCQKPALLSNLAHLQLLGAQRKERDVKSSPQCGHQVL